MSGSEALRVVRDYEIDKKTDKSFVNVLRHAEYLISQAAENHEKEALVYTFCCEDKQEKDVARKEWMMLTKLKESFQECNLQSTIRQGLKRINPETGEHVYYTGLYVKL